MVIFIIFGIERERKNNFFMETKDVEVNPIEEEQELFPEVRNRHYDRRIMDAELMHEFLDNSNDFEKIKMYKYILKKARYLEKLGTDEAKEMIPFCWLSSMELEITDALQKFFSGEITQEMIDNWDHEQAAAMVHRLQEKEAEKRTFKYQVRKFLGLRPKQNSRKR